MSRFEDDYQAARRKAYFRQSLWVLAIIGGFFVVWFVLAKFGWLPW